MNLSLADNQRAIQDAAAAFASGQRAPHSTAWNADNAPRCRLATLDDVTAAQLDDSFAPLALTDEWTPIEETNT